MLRINLRRLGTTAVSVAALMTLALIAPGKQVACAVANGFDKVVVNGVHTMPSACRRAISSSDKPNSARSTAAVCSPSSGGGRPGVMGVLEK